MSAAAVTALLNRAGGGGGVGAAASENSLHQIHLGLGCVFMLFARARVCVCVCGLSSFKHMHILCALPLILCSHIFQSVRSLSPPCSTKEDGTNKNN